MVKLGLKTAIKKEAYENRMAQNPSVLEFYLAEEDLFGQNYNVLIERIEDATRRGTKVVLHQPMKIKDGWMHLRKRNCIEEDYLRVTTRLMMNLCEKYDLKCVVHMNYGEVKGVEPQQEVFSTEEDYKDMVERAVAFVNEFDPSKKHIVLENGILGSGSYRKDMVLANLLKDTDLPLCLDISHLAISINEFEDYPNHLYTKEEIDEMNDYIEEVIKLLEKNIQYYHVVDTKADNREHDSLSLGEGVVDWSRLKKYIVKKDYIYEVGLKDLDKCDEMLVSHEYLLKK